MKRVIAFFLLISVIIVNSGCGSDESIAEPTEKPTNSTLAYAVNRPEEAYTSNAIPVDEKIDGYYKDESMYLTYDFANHTMEQMAGRARTIGLDVKYGSDVFDDRKYFVSRSKLVYDDNQQYDDYSSNTGWMEVYYYEERLCYVEYHYDKYNYVRHDYGSGKDYCYVNGEMIECKSMKESLDLLIDKYSYY